MGLRYVIGNAEDQADSINRYCNKVIEAMNQSINALRSFTDDTQLQGKTYDSAKSYVKRVHLPLAKGMVEVCEELSNQNKKYPNKYRSEVATVTVDEDQVNQHIDNIRRQKRQEETFNEVVPNPYTKGTIEIFEEMERQLRKKIEHLYEFNSETRGYFDTVNTLLDSLRRGFNELDNHQAFNPKTGTFSTDGMDLSWSKKLNDSWKKYNPKEVQIEELEDTYGLDRKTAELIVNLQDNLHDYAKKHDMSQSEENHMFFSLLASLGGYNGSIWKLSADNKDEHDLTNILHKIKLTESQINGLKKAKFINDNYDFAHLMASLSVISNKNIKKIFPDLGVNSLLNNMNENTLERINRHGYSNLDESATFRGDIASGSLDEKDYKADVDALNVGKRLNNSNKNVIDTINEYNRSLKNGNNRADELAKNYGGRNNLHDRVYSPIDDGGDILLSLKKKGNKNADDMWKYFKKDFNK